MAESTPFFPLSHDGHPTELTDELGLGEQHVEDAARALFDLQENRPDEWATWEQYPEALKEEFRVEARAVLEGAGLLDRLRAVEDQLAIQRDAAKRAGEEAGRTISRLENEKDALRSRVEKAEQAVHAILDADEQVSKLSLSEFMRLGTNPVIDAIDAARAALGEGSSNPADETTEWFCPSCDAGLLTACACPEGTQASDPVISEDPKP